MRLGCERDAATAVGIELYAVKDGRLQSVVRLVMGLVACDEHFLEVTPAIFSGEKADAIVQQVERAYCAHVERDRSRIVPVALDHPDFIAFDAMSRAKLSSEGKSAGR